MHRAATCRAKPVRLNKLPIEPRARNPDEVGRGARDVYARTQPCDEPGPSQGQRASKKGRSIPGRPFSLATISVSQPHGARANVSAFLALRDANKVPGPRWFAGFLAHGEPMAIMSRAELRGIKCYVAWGAKLKRRLKLLSPTSATAARAQQGDEEGAEDSNREGSKHNPAVYAQTRAKARPRRSTRIRDPEASVPRDRSPARWLRNRS